MSRHKLISKKMAGTQSGSWVQRFKDEGCLDPAKPNFRWITVELHG